MQWERYQLAVVLVCSTICSSACLSSAVPETADGTSRLDKAGNRSAAPLAELVGFEELTSSVRIRVITTGCTRAEDFELVIDRIGDDRVRLSVLRTRPDACRRMPAGKTIEYSRDSMGLADEAIILMNPLVELPARG